MKNQLSIPWCRGCRALLTVLILLGMVLPSAPRVVRAQGITYINHDTARSIAQERMRIQIATGRALDWNNAVLDNPTDLYDHAGFLVAYLFPINLEAAPAGYVTVAAVNIENPVLEFAMEGNSPLSMLEDLQGKVHAKGYELIEKRPLYLGPLSYAFELISADGKPYIINVFTQEISPIDLTKERDSLLLTLLYPHTQPQIEENRVLAYKIINNVPDWNQFFGSYGCASGCSPTAGINIMGYWDGRGYNNFIDGDKWQDAVDEMRMYMGTYCDDNSGATPIDKIPSGLVNYGSAHGYSLWSNSSGNPSYNDYRGQIDANRPVHVGFHNHTNYGDHSVTGVGYDTNGNYMIVHDNWPSTGEDVYVQYGVGYNTLYLRPVGFVYKLPWDISQNAWWKTQGWHSDKLGYRSLDFQPTFYRDARKDAWVLSMSSGTVSRVTICGTNQAYVIVDHPDGSVVYAHLDGNSLQVTEGVTLSIGTLIGNLYCKDSNNDKVCESYSDPCGSGDNRHLHVGFKFSDDSNLNVSLINDLVVDGKKLDDYARLAFATRVTSSNSKISNTRPTLSFNQANSTAITSRGQAVTTNNPTWTFSGTASDDQGVARVVYYAQGNNPGETQASGTTNWSYSVNGLSGHNRILFRAYDAQNQANSDNDKYFIELYVDTERPVTNYALSGTAGNAGWYRSAVQVTLNVQDQGSGNNGSANNISNHYAAGVDRVHYRVDGGAWQQQSGQQASFSVSGEGIHTVEYYAVDGVGNQEVARSFQVKIDATSPSIPGSIAETHGVPSNQWQRDISDPAFTWSPATDSGSGVAYYFVTSWPFLGGPRNGASFDPPAVRTGSYTFEVFAVDQAGNEGPRRSFTFNYDGDSPPAPGIENLDGVASGVWQNQVRTANFQWQTPVDAGSGVKGYYRYWGADANGTSDALITSNTFSSPTPFCAEGDACTYHLRVRTEDNVGWQSDWANFITRYDGAPPIADLVANYGLPVAHQTQVHLAVSASDLGSGVTQMRLSNGGYAWSDWRPLAEELYWEIPAIGRRNHDIYLQVTDAAGNLSSIISDTVYFDVNAPYPSSEGFQLWQSLTPAGAGIVSDTLHTMRVTVGQSSAAEAVQSTHYFLNPGFQAAALAIPTQTVTYTTYSQIGSLFASATNTATALASAHHRLYGSLGQPSDMRTVTSTNFVADLGFWAGAAHDLIPQPPDPPEPPIPPECEFYSLSVNNGALFTHSPLVTLNLCGPDPVEMMVSNDGGFGGALWQSYTRAISWTLTTYGNTILPRFVYARYKDSQGYIHGNFMDDIIYDPNAPQGMAAFNPADLPDIGTMQQGNTAWLMALGRPRTLRVVTEPQAQLYLSARDDSSGLAAMQVSTSPDFNGATWAPFQAITPVTFEGEGIHTVYVRTRDAAGNVSNTFSDQIVVDLTPPAIPPTGTVEVLEEVVGRGALTVTLTISATDNVGVHEARVSLSEAFTDTLWVPYTPTLVTPIRFTGELTPTLYVQLRDAAGNTSAIYTTTYLVDVTPPYGAIELVALDGTVGTLQLSAEDDLSSVTRLWLSPDFWFFQNVTVRAYEESITWDFGDSDALYIMFEDAAGNRSWPYWVGPELFEQPGSTVYLPLVMRQQ